MGNPQALCRFSSQTAELPPAVYWRGHTFLMLVTAEPGCSLERHSQIHQMVAVPRVSIDFNFIFAVAVCEQCCEAIGVLLIFSLCVWIPQWMSASRSYLCGLAIKAVRGSWLLSAGEMQKALDCGCMKIVFETNSCCTLSLLGAREVSLSVKSGDAHEMRST